MGYYSGNDCSVRMCPKGNDPLKKKVVATATIANQNSYSVIESAVADLGLFQDHDNVLVKHGSTFEQIVKIRENGAGMQALVVEPQVSAVSSATTITLTLVNQDAGEIGVTRALTELPNQVIPSITV